MIFQVIDPPKFESVKDILENAMIQQNVDKVEDLKWIIVHKRMTKDEIKNAYGIATHCLECDCEMDDIYKMLCDGCRRQT